MARCKRYRLSVLVAELLRERNSYPTVAEFDTQGDPMIVSDSCLRGHGKTATHISSSVISRSWSHVSKPSLRRMSWYCSRPSESRAPAKSTDRIIQKRGLPAKLEQLTSAQRLRVKGERVWEEKRTKM